MQPTSKTIIFFGSGPVAASSLQKLAADGFQIEAVVTKPKPEHHKGSFPVLELSEQLQLPVKTVRNKQELDVLMASHPFTSELGILIDFGIIVSQAVIDYFSYGIINSHFSLLPEWRGADPISWSILSGQAETGVSLMLLVQKMDAGPLLAQASLAIPADATTASLTNSLIDLSHQLLLTSVDDYLHNKISPYAQDSRQTPTYSRKLSKEDGALDFSKPAVELEREIRAFQPWPKSYTTLAGKDVVITKAAVVSQQGTVGQLFTSKSGVGVYCGQNALEIVELKPAGKQAMSGRAFQAGYLRS